MTKDKFDQYESIRQSGVTNMFDVNTVTSLSDDLTKEDILDIMKNYDHYKEKFKKQR